MNSTPTSPTTAHVTTAHETTRAERYLAVEQWLLLAAADAAEARREWETIGLTLLRCGARFTAISIPGVIVHAAAGTSEPASVDAFLAEVLDHGPVFAAPGLERYYAIVGASAVRDGDVSAAECLPRGCLLGVPAVPLIQYESGVPYWAVPMDSPGDFCLAAPLADLVACGGARMAAPQRESSERGTIL